MPRRTRNDGFQFTALHYLDSNMLTQFVGGLNDGVSFERDITTAKERRQGFSGGPKIGLDLIAQAELSAEFERKSSVTTEETEVRVHTLETLFSKLFNDPQFRDQVITLDPNESLALERRSDDIRKDQRNKIVRLSGQIVRVTDGVNTRGDLVDLLVGPEERDSELHCQAVAFAQASRTGSYKATCCDRDVRARGRRVTGKSVRKTTVKG
jgi:hypothetical protein